nr:MAG: capsid protein [Cressdnaviricota sp.]
MYPQKKRLRPKIMGKIKPTKRRINKEYQTYNVSFLEQKYIPRAPAVLRSNRGETKSVDIVSANYLLNATGTVAALNLLESGSSSFQRIGRKIEMKSLQIKGMLNGIGANSQGLISSGRILIVYDRQTNGALPVYADVIKSQTQVSGTTQSLNFDFINLDNRDRFQIIRDVEFSMPSVTRVASADTFSGYPTSAHTDSKCEEGQFNMFIKLGGLVTHFKADSTPGVIGDVATGSLLILTFGAFASGSEGWNANLSFRLRYNDN